MFARKQHPSQRAIFNELTNQILSVISINFISFLVHKFLLLTGRGIQMAQGHVDPGRQVPLGPCRYSD